MTALPVLASERDLPGPPGAETSRSTLATQWWPPGSEVRTIHSMYADRIVADHYVMGGVPCVRGTRTPAATVVGLIAEGITPEGIVAEYPQLALDDVRAALEFAAAAVDERQLPLRTPA